MLTDAQARNRARQGACLAQARDEVRAGEIPDWLHEFEDMSRTLARRIGRPELAWEFAALQLGLDRMMTAPPPPSPSDIRKALTRLRSDVLRLISKTRQLDRNFGVELLDLNEEEDVAEGWEYSVRYRLGELEQFLTEMIAWIEQYDVPHLTGGAREAATSVAVLNLVGLLLQYGVALRTAAIAVLAAELLEPVIESRRAVWGIAGKFSVDWADRAARYQKEFDAGSA